MKKTKFLSVALALSMIATLCTGCKTAPEQETLQTVTFDIQDLIDERSEGRDYTKTYKDDIPEESSEDEKELLGELITYEEEDSYDVFSPDTYNGSASIIVNGGQPYFTEEDMENAKNNSFENYSSLDSLGRCGVAFASLGPDTLPAEGETRGSIGMVKPSGWCQNKYQGVISSNENEPQYLYNRCHLIAWCLGAENANEKNLITGTRYMNMAMTDVEIPVVRYIEETGDRVAYRVTPIFQGDNLLASGVVIEAKSCNSDTINICTYYYNVQPGVYIDYATGENHLL